MYRPDRRFLARWWVNGKPFVPSQMAMQLMDENGRVTTGARLDLLLDFDPARFDARPGGRIGLQLLYCRAGWELATDEKVGMLRADPSDEGPLFLLSNRIEFTGE